MSDNDSFQPQSFLLGNTLTSNQRSETPLHKQLAAKLSHIKGWAVDANPHNDPTYPIRSRFEGDRSGYDWQRPVQQRAAEGILQSNERPHMTSVFGTSVPATGISGAIRRYAFKFSEGRFRHWLLLLLADRVNTVEGLANDVADGHMPRYLTEKGFNAQWKYNRKAVVTRVAISTAVIASIAFLAIRKKE